MPPPLGKALERFKLHRPNMADMVRTFTGTGETTSHAPPPATTLEVSSDIQAVMEFCRPLSRISTPDATVPIDESCSRGIATTVAAGAGTLSAPLILLRRGVWRITMDLSFLCSGAAPAVTNYALLTLVGPDAVYGSGIHLMMGDIRSPISGVSDFLIHTPTDEWYILLEIADPVTALAVNRVRGSVLCCHLL